MRDEVRHLDTDAVKRRVQELRGPSKDQAGSTGSAVRTALEEAGLRVRNVDWSRDRFTIILKGGRLFSGSDWAAALDALGAAMSSPAAPVKRLSLTTGSGRLDLAVAENPSTWDAMERLADKLQAAFDEFDNIYTVGAPDASFQVETVGSLTVEISPGDPLRDPKHWLWTEGGGPGYWKFLHPEVGFLKAPYDLAISQGFDLKAFRAAWTMRPWEIWELQAYSNAPGVPVEVVSWPWPDRMYPKINVRTKIGDSTSMVEVAAIALSRRLAKDAADYKLSKKEA